MNALPIDRRGWFRLAVGLAVAAIVGVIVRPGARPEPSKEAPGVSIPETASPVGDGSLVIAGGGRLPDEVFARFLALAGGQGARIVLIPTARSPDYDAAAPSEELDPWTARGVASARLLHTRSRPLADDPSFAAPLSDATGVWIGGGVQSRLSETYAGTEVERQLVALLGRGGVIGGTSAGAAIMTRVMIAGGQVEAIEGRGFDLLPGAVVDQHFLKRGRIARLTGLLERHPELVGFGVDEGTALVVDLRGRRVEVVGESSVVACLPKVEGQPARLRVLKPGDRGDLASLLEPKPKPSPLTLSPRDGPGRSR